jgi:hypothetical protein
MALSIKVQVSDNGNEPRFGEMNREEKSEEKPRTCLSDLISDGGLYGILMTREMVSQKEQEHDFP